MNIILHFIELNGPCKKAAFLQLYVFYFFTEMYFCKKAASLRKNAAFLQIYNCKKAAFLWKNAALLQLYICKKSCFWREISVCRKNSFDKYSSRK